MALASPGLLTGNRSQLFAGDSEENVCFFFFFI